MAHWGNIEIARQNPLTNPHARVYIINVSRELAQDQSREDDTDDDRDVYGDWPIDVQRHR